MTGLPGARGGATDDPTGGGAAAEGDAAGAAARPWLVVIDMQRIFAEPPSPWASPDYAAASSGVRRLLPHFGPRVVFTRFVAPREPAGSWIPYYRQWDFARVPPEDRLYEIMPEFDTAGASVVTRETFGKWGAELAAAVGGGSEIVLAGVSTDCCVISTALPAADAGMHVRVVADACAGASAADHRRALEAMDLFAPMIEVVTVDEVIAAESGAGAAG